MIMTISLTALLGAWTLLTILGVVELIVYFTIGVGTIFINIALVMSGFAVLIGISLIVIFIYLTVTS
jgi:hypothetical protein